MRAKILMSIELIKFSNTHGTCREIYWVGMTSYRKFLQNLSQEAAGFFLSEVEKFQRPSTPGQDTNNITDTEAINDHLAT